MVIKIDWKKIGYKEYKDIHYSSNYASIINIDEKEYFSPFDIHTFNNEYITRKDLPFPVNGIIHMTCSVINDQIFPDIKNILEFTEKVLKFVENTNAYEGSFGLEFTDEGPSLLGPVDQNGNMLRQYKFIHIL